MKLTASFSSNLSVVQKFSQETRRKVLKKGRVLIWTLYWFQTHPISNPLFVKGLPARDKIQRSKKKTTKQNLLKVEV